MRDYDLRDLLPDVTVPLLLMPGPEHQVVSVEQPDDVAAVLLEFLAQNGDLTEHDQ